MQRTWVRDCCHLYEYAIRSLIESIPVFTSIPIKQSSLYLSEEAGCLLNKYFFSGNNACFASGNNQEVGGGR